MKVFFFRDNATVGLRYSLPASSILWKSWLAAKPSANSRSSKNEVFFSLAVSELRPDSELQFRNASVVLRHGTHEVVVEFKNSPGFVVSTDQGGSKVFSTEAFEMCWGDGFWKPQAVADWVPPTDTRPALNTTSLPSMVDESCGRMGCAMWWDSLGAELRLSYVPKAGELPPERLTRHLCWSTL